MPFSSRTAGQLDDADVSISGTVFCDNFYSPAIVEAARKIHIRMFCLAIDDLRPALGCYGDPLEVSRIDAFARTARQFILMHTFSKQSVDLPERQFTGFPPDHTRVWHNRNKFRDTQPDHVTLLQFFKQHGYTTRARKIFSGNEGELDPVSWSSPEILRKPGWSNYVWQKTRKGESNLQLRWQMFQTTPIRTVSLPALQSKP